MGKRGAAKIANVGFHRKLPFGASCGSGSNVPDFAIRQARQEGIEGWLRDLKTFLGVMEGGSGHNAVDTEHVILPTRLVPNGSPAPEVVR